MDSVDTELSGMRKSEVETVKTFISKLSDHYRPAYGRADERTEEVTMDSVDTVQTIVAAIKPQLAGHAPEVQGAVLADLLAMWLAGHPPQVRMQSLTFHVAMVRDLVPVNERLIFGERGHPDGPA